MKRIFALMSGLITLVFSHAAADCRGKVDVAPVFAHLDVMNFGKTVKTMDLPGIKADINYLVWKGLCLKPSVLYAENQGHLFTGGLGVGFAFPYKRWCFTPGVGANYTDVETKIPLEAFGMKLKVKEKFTSWSPYLSFELFYRISKEWRVGVLYQYAWSRTHTKIQNFGSDKSNAKGPCYSMLIERDFNQHWSINLGATYNISLTKEKHGIRGYGFKLGLARWF